MIIGQTIESFRAPASTGQTLSWGSFAGKVPIAMAFIPASEDNEALLTELSERHKDFSDRRIQLLGVAPETATDLRDVADRLDITFPILAAPAGSMFRSFHAIGSDGQPTERVVIVDRSGTVAGVSEDEMSATAMLNAIDALDDSNFEMRVNS